MIWCDFVRQNIPEYGIKEIVWKFCSQTLIFKVKSIVFALNFRKHDYCLVTCLFILFFSLFIFDNHFFLTVFEVVRFVEIVYTPSAGQIVGKLLIECWCVISNYQYVLLLHQNVVLYKVSSIQPCFHGHFFDIEKLEWLFWRHDLITIIKLILITQ